VSDLAVWARLGSAWLVTFIAQLEKFQLELITTIYVFSSKLKASMVEFWGQGSNGNIFFSQILLIWLLYQLPKIFMYKVFQKFKLSKCVKTKKYSLELNQNQYQKDSDDSWQWKLTLNVRFGDFLTARVKVRQIKNRFVYSIFITFFWAEIYCQLTLVLKTPQLQSRYSRSLSFSKVF
jgi:hypothetical protein